MNQEQNLARSRTHQVQIEHRSKAILTGVSDVDSFHEAEVNLITEAGYATITGHDLHISHLSLEEGQLVVEGSISGIQYRDQAGGESGFWNRLFKG